MNNKLTPKQVKYQKTKKKNELNTRFYHRNIEAMRWCNQQGLTIYAAAQAYNSTMVKVFVQKGVPFKPLNDVLYNQNEPEDVKKYTAAIDAEYERLYIKMKDRV